MKSANNNIIKIYPDRIPGSLVNRAARVLKSGGVVVFPTDTVYGLGCLAGNEQAREKIYHLKKREKEKSLPVLVSSIKEAEKLVTNGNGTARRLMKAFWPGPLTLVLTAAEGGTIGLRMPAHKVALALLKKTGPLAVTSVNLSGQPSAKTITDIPDNLLKAIDLVLDSGRCELTVESTVLDLTGPKPRILRQGYLSRNKILKALKNV
jgi:L-threonylcarbamoyladenylate synthase